MRRASALLLALGLAQAGPAAAQTQRVSLIVRLAPEADVTGARRARVTVRDLLTDSRWSEALGQSFPIRLSFRLEIWRSRAGPDELQRSAEWSTVVQREPLEDQYRVTQILLSGPVEHRYATRDELSRALGTTTEVDALPTGTGTFYYDVTLRITPLSDEDMEELERFLAGQVNPPPRSGRGSIGHSLRRFLLGMAGLPSENLEARSELFRIGGPR
ncbi:MAG TPA: hypothetical protein VGQ17_03110 [Gemmatimonadales bacterium]|jgi:hypothetical protein|nr:hypothetical protein [Gemmatimonadales bacterium]